MSRILIVEADSPYRDTLAATLRTPSCEVFTAASGGESLRLASEYPPDLLILNMLLPGLDDLALRQLLLRCAPAPVLMRPGSDTGADPRTLVSRARALLAQPSAAEASPPTLLIAGNLSLDLLHRRAQLAGAHLKLTQKEFDLLAQLMRHRGDVLSRDQLLNRVWGQPYTESRHTVDVHIRWLREKIEAHPSTPERIITVRGAGYRFDK